MYNIHSFMNSWKGVLSLIVSLIVVITFFSTTVENKMDAKISLHEAEAEAEYQKDLGELKIDIEVLKEGVKNNQVATKHNQELLEEILRKVD